MEAFALITAVLVFIYGICYEPHAIRKSKGNGKKDN